MSGKTRTRAQYAEQKYLDQLFKSYQSGVLDKPGIELLKRKGYITDKGQKYVDKSIKAPRVKATTMSTKNWLDLMDPFTRWRQWQQMRPVTKDQWMPDSLIDHSEDFIHWINSMLHGAFSTKSFYKKFDYYKAQAWQWLQDKDTYFSYKTDDERRDFATREYNRCSENTLYFANKYGELKEGDAEHGFLDYNAKEHHAVIFYMCDCGYNFFGGKGRQIGFTSAMGLYATKKLVFSYNYFMKFISEDEDTSEEIFVDKIKYPFSTLPGWMKPPVRSDRGTRLELSDKKKKGDKGYPNSRITVIPPRKTAINGGSPQLVLMDEIGNIGILTEMLNEGRPTMFWNNPKTGEFEMRRQVIGWSCVTAGTKVTTVDGRMINVEDLIKEDGILGFDQDKGEISEEPITMITDPVEKPCYRIETNFGSVLECSYDHPVLSSHPTLYKTPRVDGVKKYQKLVEWKETKWLKIGDQVAVAADASKFGSARMWEPRFVGWMVGDGSYGLDSTPVLSNCDDEINSYVDNNFDCTVEHSNITSSGKLYRETRIRGICGKLREFGIYGQTKDSKRLPVNLHDFTKEDIAEFLGGLYDTDGCVVGPDKTGKVVVELDSMCEEMLREVKLSLQRFGIQSNLSRIKGRESELVYGDKDSFRLVIAQHDSVVRFFENIKFSIKYKQEKLEKCAESCRKATWRKGKAKNLPGMAFETVKSVDYIGVKPVYNLTAGNTHTYIANGIITHNTGGAMDKSKGAYEREWYRIVSLWEAKRFRQSGFIPLFFSWHARFSREEYDREKEWYYGARAAEEDIDLETSKTQFHQHYPSNPMDMFLRTDNTLVARDIIQGGIDRCKSLSVHQAPVYGYFEPIYNMDEPMPPESDTPYRITGANFVPLNDDDDPKLATAIMFQRPQPGWKNRYWQGTDPIATETGHSKMASVVWDDYLKTPVCVINYRKQHDHLKSYLQCLLMGLYYDNEPIKRGIKDLVESNIGTNYIDYKRSKGFFDNLTFNSELPTRVLGGSREVGIDNKGTRADAIIDFMAEMLRAFHDRFYIKVIFDQLSTFVCKISDKGKETWEAQSKLLHYDDVLYALVFSFINKLSHPNLNPIQIEAEHFRTRVRYKLVRQSDGSLIRKPVKEVVNEQSEMTEIPIDVL